MSQGTSNDTVDSLRKQLSLLKRRDRYKTRQIEKLRERNRELEATAFTDELTKLLRRTPVIDRLERELQPYPMEQRAAKRGTESIAVLAIDLVGFKAVNDAQDHHAGDQALRNVAAAIRAAIRSGDLAARWGGDEFVIVLWNLSKDSIFVIVERILSGIRKSHPTLNARIGGVFWERASATNPLATDLLRQAEHNERELKRGGKIGLRLSTHGT